VTYDAPKCHFDVGRQACGDSSTFGSIARVFFCAVYLERKRDFGIPQGGERDAQTLVFHDSSHEHCTHCAGMEDGDRRHGWKKCVIPSRNDNRILTPHLPNIRCFMVRGRVPDQTALETKQTKGTNVEALLPLLPCERTFPEFTSRGEYTHCVAE
jgi:hypothetical protein